MSGIAGMDENAVGVAIEPSFSLSPLLVLLHNIDVGVETSISDRRRHGLELSDPLLDSSLHKPLALIDDLVGVEAGRDDGRNDESLKTSGEEL